ncbi:MULTISPECIES: GTP pyrophosphokinase [unclassified Nocardioides]|uniref:GTP pyrophosphokinase n=1 Tax=unclassified Nocardioides TaxID=2615069 RepID=UPI0009E94B21|nr:MULTISPECIES: GTP pyrophosphokinase family protein [unclassified Nocardioides]
MSEPATSAPRVDLLRGLIEGTTDPAEAEQSLREIQAELAAFRLEYSCGMEEVATKINILRQEFEQTQDFGPIEHVKTRLKSMDSLVDKMRRIDCPPDLVTVRERIRDIAGIRVTCAFVEDTYRVAEMLTRQPDLTVLETKDYIATPKANGYQSLHLIVEVPVFLSDRSINVPVELQIRTIAMDFWASVEHRIYYKYDGAVPDDLQQALLTVASTASDLDGQMGRLRDEIQSLATSE